MNDLSEEDRKKAVEVLAGLLNVPQDQLAGDARLVEDLGADSLNIAELSMALEEEFKVTVPDERLDEIKTVGDLFDLLSDLLENSPKS